MTCPVPFFSVSPRAAPGAERVRNALAQGGVLFLGSHLHCPPVGLLASRRLKVLPCPRCASPRPPTPAPAPAVTCSRKRCTALSMVSRPARCLRRALAAAPRAVRRPVHRRTTAADNKQQTRATPETPDSAVHTWRSTIVSCSRLLPERNQHAQPNSSAAKPGLDRRRFRPREGRAQPPERAVAGQREQSWQRQRSRSSLAACWARSRRPGVLKQAEQLSSAWAPSATPGLPGFLDQTPLPSSPPCASRSSNSFPENSTKPEPLEQARLSRPGAADLNPPNISAASFLGSQASSGVCIAERPSHLGTGSSEGSTRRPLFY